MSWEEERRARQAIVDIHKKLYALGFSVANDGNTSVRVGKDRLLITPMGLNKATLRPDQIVRIDMAGKTVSGGAHPPSSERALHTTIYKIRPDVRAIVHAHPPYAIACSLAGVSLEEPILPEVVASLGPVPTARYATPGTEEFAVVAAELIARCDAIVLARHGAVSVGNTLEEALQKLERVEHTARILGIARSMGTVAPLAKPEVDKLLEIAARTGSYHAAAAPPSAPKADEDLIELITREVRAALSEGQPKRAG